MRTVMVVVVLLAGAPAQEFAEGLPRPTRGTFVVDRAGLITSDDLTRVRTDCARLMAESEGEVPLLVVTIRSKRDYDGSGLSIERFARKLFDKWGIGQRAGKNRGILLLVARNDRRARIELGGGWSGKLDDACVEIMNERMVPRFKDGDYSGGIAEGVRCLCSVARGGDLPSDWSAKRVVPWAIVTLVVVVSALSFGRSGTRGIAGQFWGGLFRLIGRLLVARTYRRGQGWTGVPRTPLARRRFNRKKRMRRRLPSDPGFYATIHGDHTGYGGGFGGGGGFSGGSFGGGFGGGGGASGSW